MKNDYKDQEAFFDEIMRKIDQLQQDEPITLPAAAGSTADQAGIVDEEIFDEVKNSRHFVDASSKSPIRRFLDGEEEENDADEEPPAQSVLFDEAQAEIEDFESDDERDEIYRDLKNTVGKMAVKTALALLLVLASGYLFAAGYYPALFAWKVDSVLYQAALLGVDLLSAGLFFGIFAQGLGRLLHARAGTDTLLALLCISLIVVRVCYMAKPALFSYGITLEPLLSVSLWFNVRAKKKIASNIKHNFKQISLSGDKLTVTEEPSCEAKNDLILETGAGGEVAFAHKTGLVSRFIDHSYGDFEWDERIQFFLFFTVLLVLAGAVAISQITGLGEAVLFPAAAFSISVPVFARYYYAASIWQNGKKIRKSGGVLTSAESAKELQDAELLVVSEETFMGDQAVLLQGIKAIGDMQIDELITNIAALFSNVGTPMKALFMRMIDERTVALPRVDDIYYHEGLGYTCLIHSKLFLVGNAAMMKQFNIAFPEKLEKMNLGSTRFPVFVAYHKSPVGVFITGYESCAQTEAAIRILKDTSVNVGVVSGDFNFSDALLRQLYPGLEPDQFCLISSKTANVCRPYLARKEKSSDLIASRTGLQGLSACFRGISRLLSALKINRFIRVLYTVLALALIFFIAIAGYSASTTLHILAFQAIWLLPVASICYFYK